MYGYPLILLPDVCELPVKRQRKKKAPMPVSAPPPPPPPRRRRGTVRACALPPVPGGHCQGKNATRGLRLCEAWAARRHTGGLVVIRFPCLKIAIR